MYGFDGDSLQSQSVLCCVYDAKASRANFLLEKVLLFDIPLPGAHEHSFFDHDVFIDPLVYQLRLFVLLKLL